MKMMIVKIIILLLITAFAGWQTVLLIKDVKKRISAKKHMEVDEINQSED